MASGVRQYFEQTARRCHQALVGLFTRYGVEGSITGHTLVKAVNAAGAPFAAELADIAGYPAGGRDKTVSFILAAANRVADESPVMQQATANEPKPVAEPVSSFTGLTYHVGAPEEPKIFGIPRTMAILGLILLLMAGGFFAIKFT